MDNFRYLALLDDTIEVLDELKHEVSNHFADYTDRNAGADALYHARREVMRVRSGLIADLYDKEELVRPRSGPSAVAILSSVPEGEPSPARLRRSTL